MRSKVVIVLLYLTLLCIYNPTYLSNIGNTSFSASAHLQESNQDNEVQRNLGNFESRESDPTPQIKQGHGVGGHGGHGGHGGSHGGSTGGGGSSSSGGQAGAVIIPQNTGGAAQNLRNTHRNGCSSYKRYAGYLPMVTIFLGVLNIQHNQ